MSIVTVGLDVPLAREFEYIAVDATQADIGRRAVVPFGRRTAIGVVLDVSEHSQISADKLKRVNRIVRDAPGLSMEDLRLLRFASEYYHYPLGQVVTTALPTRLKRP